MTHTLMNFVPATPEIILLVIICATLLVAAFVRANSQACYMIAQVGLVLTALSVVHTFIYADSGMSAMAFRGMFVLDHLAVVLKVLTLVVVFFTLLFSRAYNNDRDMPRNEYYLLALLSTLGMMILTSAHNLLTIYMGLELFSLPTFAMVAIQRQSFRGVEAGLKYCIVSCVGSGLLLYGFSFFFGVSGSLDLNVIAHRIVMGHVTVDPLLSMALVFVVAGIAFKLGVVPFQMWVPDVYDGAPTSTTLFIAAAPKLAAFAMMVRLLIGAMPSLHANWQVLLIILAILSMAVGNFSAIMQTNIKRLLAYSSIAHMGYMLLGLIAGTPSGYSASLFYVMSYAIMTVAGFGVLLLMNRQGCEVTELDDLSGLGSRSPWLAFVMLLVVFSMAGVPPLLGFIAKVQLLEALIHANYVWLVVLTLLFSVVGMYYYLRIVQRMYFQDAKSDLPAISYRLDAGVGITINGLVVLLVGIFPNALYTLALHAFVM